MSKMTTMSIKKFLKLGGSIINPTMFENNLEQKGMAKNRVDLLVAFYKVLTECDIFSDEVYDVVVNRKPYIEVSTEYDISEMTLKNRITYEVGKFSKQLTFNPVDIASDSSYSTDTLFAYTTFLNDLYEASDKRKSSDIFGELVLDLDKQVSKSHVHTTIIDSSNRNEFNKVITTMQAISKPYLEQMVKFSDDKMLGYIFYLLRTPEKYLSVKDREMREEILELWMLYDYI